MKFVLKIILIISLSYFLQPHLPWWIIGVIPFLLSIIIKTNGASSFFSGFLSIGGLWFYISYNIDLETHSILTEKIASLFTLNNSVYLILITSLIGAVVAGLGGLSGYTFIKLFEKKKSPYY